MVPKSIVIVPGLPRTNTAKLNKRALSQEFE
jgi:acyl-coenzyme A synthetase/AMP-(fatty) acid ligase